MVKVYWQALVWNSLVIVLSVLPAGSFPETGLIRIAHLDKIVHFSMYAVLTFLILRKNPVVFPGTRKIILWSWTFVHVFFTGFFLELFQNYFIIGRVFDIFDVLANTAGSLVALLIFEMFHRVNKKSWILR